MHTKDKGKDRQDLKEGSPLSNAVQISWLRIVDLWFLVRATSPHRLETKIARARESRDGTGLDDLIHPFLMRGPLPLFVSNCEPE